MSVNKEYGIINPNKDGCDWEIIGKPFIKLEIDTYAKL